MDVEKVALYEATLARLEGQVVGLQRGRKKLIRILYATLVLSPVLFFVVSKLAALIVFIAGVSVYGVGHYIAMVHLIEDGSAITAARATIAELRGEDSGDDA